MKYVEQYLNAGIKCFTSQGTIDSFKFKGLKRPTEVESLKVFDVGNFSIMGFDAQHDAPQPLGFVINHDKIGNLVFLTDSYYSKFTFENINSFLVECNYSHSIAHQNAMSDKVSVAQIRRLHESHMSLERCIKFLKANNLSKVRNIVLLHLSDANSDAEDFKEKVTRETGKQVFVADKGLEVDLNLNYF